MFTFTTFEIMLFEEKSVLAPTQWGYRERKGPGFFSEKPKNCLAFVEIVWKVIALQD